MTLKERIERDLTRAVYGSNQQKDLKVIIGEIQRLPNKNPDDEEVVKILRILKKNGNENIKILHSITPYTMEEIRKIADDIIKNESFINSINDYLPEECVKMTEDEVFDWISKKIDFSSFKNKMAAIKPILNMLDGKADGETIRKVIVEKF